MLESFSMKIETVYDDDDDDVDNLVSVINGILANNRKKNPEKILFIMITHTH